MACKTLNILNLAVSRKKFANPCSEQKAFETPTRGQPRSDMDRRKSPNYMRIKKYPFNAYLDSVLAEKEGSILLKKNPVLPENTLYLLAWPKL